MTSKDSSAVDSPSAYLYGPPPTQESASSAVKVAADEEQYTVNVSGRMHEVDLRCTESIWDDVENFVDERKPMEESQPMNLMNPFALKEMMETVCEDCVMRNACNTSKFMVCTQCIEGQDWTGPVTDTLPPSIKRSHAMSKRMRIPSDPPATEMLPPSIKRSHAMSKRMRIAIDPSQSEVCRIVDFNGVGGDDETD